MRSWHGRTPAIATKVESFQNLLIAYATGEKVEESEFTALRSELVANRELSDRLPRLVPTCRSLRQFWALISSKSETYKGRREYLWAEFGPLLQELEGVNGTPADSRVSEVLKEFDADHVHRTWETALQRRVIDPDGAVTLARTLLETVCKHLLDKVGISYASNADLPGLYRLVALRLCLAPSQDIERPVRQMMGGATTAVEGIGALRNRTGDAHGKGQLGDATTPQLAELAVNLAGAMALFLVETWQEQRDDIPF